MQFVVSDSKCFFKRISMLFTGNQCSRHCLALSFCMILLTLTMSLPTIAQSEDHLNVNDTIIFIDDAVDTLSNLLELDNEYELNIFKRPKKLDPKRAAMLSAVFPGLGQVYNRQAWKLPIVYGGALLVGIVIDYNNRFYQIFRNEAQAVALFGEGSGRLGISSTNIQRFQENYRRDRDFSIILGCAFYALQIIDAHVSAHLKEFDISDDLSMSVHPTLQKTPGTSPFRGHSLGLSLSFALK